MLVAEEWIRFALVLRLLVLADSYSCSCSYSYSYEEVEVLRSLPSKVGELRQTVLSFPFRLSLGEQHR